jgi:TetR/AcrR family transcriptional regulator, cholesterol catabolism regulator
MQDIAAAVGLRKPTLYHYFTSKDEILYWIHDEFIELLIARHTARVQVAADPEQEVLEVIGDILELMETHHGHVRVFFEHRRELPPAQHEAIERKRSHYQRLVSDSIARGVAAGTFRDVDVPLATLALFGVCNWSYQWYRTGGRLTSRQLADVFFDLLLHGLTAAPDDRRPA